VTEKELEKIFADVRAEVYSPEYRNKIEEKVKNDTGLDDKGVSKLALTLATNSELDKAFMFRVLSKTLCDK